MKNSGITEGLGIKNLGIWEVFGDLGSKIWEFGIKTLGILHQGFGDLVLGRDFDGISVVSSFLVNNLLIVH